MVIYRKYNYTKQNITMTSRIRQSAHQAETTQNRMQCPTAGASIAPRRTQQRRRPGRATAAPGQSPDDPSPGGQPDGDTEHETRDSPGRGGSGSPHPRIQCSDPKVQGPRPPPPRAAQGPTLRAATGPTPEPGAIGGPTGRPHRAAAAPPPTPAPGNDPAAPATHPTPLRVLPAQHALGPTPYII